MILHTVITWGAVVAIIALSRFIWAMLAKAIAVYKDLRDDQ